MANIHDAAASTQLSPAHLQGAKEQHTRLAYACYFALGSGILAPWNAFITAADYFEAVFPGRHMDRLFTIAYLPVCLLLLAVMIKYNNLPVRCRILTSFASFTLIMAIIPLVDTALVGPDAEGSNAALAVVLLAVVIVGLLDGASQGAIFGDASDLPPQYTHAVVGGTASSGVIICLLRIVTKAALPPTRAGLRSSTAIYFALSGVICLLCFFVYHSVLPRLGVVRYYKTAAKGHKAIELSPQPSLTLDNTDEDPGHLVVLQGPDDQYGSGSKRARLTWQHVAAEAWESAVALFLLYAVTLSIFPGVLAEDLKSDLLGDWYGVVLITIFNICDLIGKNVPFCGLAPRPRTLLVCSSTRILFVPAFLLAGKYAGHTVWLISMLTISLGLSNGLLTALTMTLAPASVAAGEADLVENIMVFSLVAGLSVGAFAGWLWLV
eukprot:gene11647-11792_t